MLLAISHFVNFLLWTYREHGAKKSFYRFSITGTMGCDGKRRAFSSVSSGRHLRSIHVSPCRYMSYSVSSGCLSGTLRLTPTRHPLFLRQCPDVLPWMPSAHVPPIRKYACGSPQLVKEKDWGCRFESRVVRTRA